MKELAKRQFEKGDFISPQMIEEEIGHSPTQFELLSLWSMMDETHKDKTVKMENGGIRFLTDKEASPYNHGLFGRYFFGMKKRHRKMLSVKVSEFTDKEKSEHERCLEIQADIITGAENGMRKHLEPKKYNNNIKKLFY
jgi:hypothetical protein